MPKRSSLFLLAPGAPVASSIRPDLPGPPPAGALRSPSIDRPSSPLLSRARILLARVVPALAAAAALLLTSPDVRGQTWPASAVPDQGSVEWIVGVQSPVSGLGSFGSYRMSMDAWPHVGLSARNPAGRDLRIRFDGIAAPGVPLRRHPVRCPECSEDSSRLTVVSARFLGSLTVLRGEWGRGVVTAGPAMRLQIGESDACSASAGEECALPEFTRERIDPGLMAAVGWERREGWLRAVEVAGRVSLYGRGELPLAAPAPLLGELELSVRLGDGR